MVSELCTETLHGVVGCAGTRTRYRARVYTLGRRTRRGECRKA